MKAIRRTVRFLPYESPRALRKRLAKLPALEERPSVALPSRSERRAAKLARAQMFYDRAADYRATTPFTFDLAKLRRSSSHGYVAPKPMSPRESLARAFKGSMKQR